MFWTEVIFLSAKRNTEKKKEKITKRKAISNSFDEMKRVASSGKYNELRTKKLIKKNEDEKQVEGSLWKIIQALPSNLLYLKRVHLHFVYIHNNS